MSSGYDLTIPDISHYSQLEYQSLSTLEPLLKELLLITRYTMSPTFGIISDHNNNRLWYLVSNMKMTEDESYIQKLVIMDETQYTHVYQVEYIGKRVVYSDDFSKLVIEM